MDPITIGAAVVTAAMAITGGITSVFSNQDAIDSLEDQLKYIEQLYTLKKQEADLSFANAKETAEKNAAIAQKQADIKDIGEDVKEGATSFDFNAAIDNLYLSQLEDSMTWNAQQRSIGQSEGASLASLAGSGIRAGSSLSQAVEMEAAANEAQLQFSQDAKRSTDDNNLGNLLYNLAGTKVDIYGNRVEADVTRQQATDLYNSYQVGGYNYNLYQNQLQQMQTSYNADVNKIKDQIDERSGFWGGVKAFFGGFNSGYSSATNLTNFITNDVTKFTTGISGSSKSNKSTKSNTGSIGGKARTSGTV